ncbi:MAG: response regulator [Prochlorotrichaceae cyanobacterium]
MSAHKILVIDDSRVIRMRVNEMLPKGDFELLEAKDGVEGLNLIKQEHPNLIMLDFILPKMSGWEVFQHVQADDVLQRIPLVVMSGRKEEVTEKLSEPFEFFEFIEKPFEKSDLMAAIKSAMQKARKRPPSISPTSAPPAPQGAPGDQSEHIAALNARVEHLEAEVGKLKQQLAQVLQFVKQKLK